jgi:hypothetical protein
VSHPILAGVLTGALAAPLLGAVLVGPVAAGPVLCKTTLEAPLGSSAPVEVTRCGAIETVPDRIERRYYGWRAPFARGVSLTHQITDVLGIAMGGGVNGNRIMGLGFPDQAIVWDGSAVENTALSLLEEQNVAMPLRTADLPSCFGSSLAGTACGTTTVRAEPYDPGIGYDWGESVRGLW